MASKGQKRVMRFPCGVCKEKCLKDCLACALCNKWFHRTCQSISEETFNEWGDIELNYVCVTCRTTDGVEFDYQLGMRRLQKGSVVSMAVFYPLDTARTRLQVDDKRQARHSPVVMAEIVQEEGFSALYRGIFPVVSTLCCSNFVYFYTYNGLKAMFLAEGDPVKDLTFGFIAGVVNVLVTTPLWVVNTRLKLQGAKFKSEDLKDNEKVRYKGIIDCIIKIVRREGVGALWNGTKPSLVLASNPSIQFMVYEAVKRYFQRALQQVELSGFLYFVIGAIAKAVATVITYPLQILQSKLRAGYSRIDQSKGMWQSVIDMIKSHGVKGLYKGMEAKLLQTVLTAALMFMVYEKIASTVFRLMGLQFTQPKKL